MDIEKHTLLSMFKGVFFIDLDDHAEKYGWKKLLLVILALCIIRGLGRMFFWDDSFWEGFFYPIFLFGTVSLIILPLFLLHTKYKNTPPEEIPPTKHPKLITTLKVIGVPTYFVSLFFVGIVAEDLFTVINENMVYFQIVSMENHVSSQIFLEKKNEEFSSLLLHYLS